MKKGQKFWYYGELVSYTYYSVKYNSHHFSNSVCKDNQIPVISSSPYYHNFSEVIANQGYHKNYKMPEIDENQVLF